ncbi:40S ribosomal protein eS10 [Ascoidea rubescens DSM 1968]|uniref:Ribosomal protein S10A n=1 Tax=Ascoidea rubescens DSM 1968 TaxID=1344418 RepID=A0A1D2VCQ0_9ASCO|nr:ribosomal protein S10A [Ascoidea rubescens DSM 1968]ODV59389.1 ribosomal protein S10A [Ascoidea rubescens DSM 1968]
MLIPKEDRKKIHSYLFQEGVVVAKKDFNQPKHEEIDTKNLYVIKALQSLTSKGYVKTQFSWQYYYYTLTDEGVEYLREWLQLPEGILPLTHIKQAVPERPNQRRRGAPRRFEGRGRE